MALDNEVAMENVRRTASGDPRPARTPSREQQLSFFLVWFTRCT